MSPPHQTLLSPTDDPRFAAGPSLEFRVSDTAPREESGRGDGPREYVAARWANILARSGLLEFQQIWGLDAKWFEPINHRRGGWSGASRIEVDPGTGKLLGLFLKRQERHYCRALRNPLQRIPTYLREYQNLLLCQKLGIPAPRVVYFGLGPDRSKAQAILITEELAGYRPIAEWLNDASSDGRGNLRARRAVMRELGALVRKLHRNRLQHHALKPNNIFLRIDPHSNEPSLCLLDLEMMRWHPRPVYRDLLTLYRKTARVTNTDRLAFFLAYLGRDRLDGAGSRLWRKLSARYRRKGHPNPAD